MKTNTPCYKAFKEAYPSLVCSFYLEVKEGEVFGRNDQVHGIVLGFEKGYNATMKEHKRFGG